MSNIAVILSGCGVFDGAEIHESVLTLLAIDTAGASYQCFAPDIPQAHVVNHAAGAPDESASRNVLQEAARIARGEIKPLNELSINDFDAIVLPGGFGAAKNLCNFAFDAENLEVLPELASILEKAQQNHLPLAFACIAPAIAAKVFGSQKLKFTIGTDAGTAEALQQHGGTHVDCPVTDIVVDEHLKIVTTPAYMLAERISEANEGLTKMIHKTIELAKQQ